MFAKFIVFLALVAFATAAPIVDSNKRDVFQMKPAIVIPTPHVFPNDFDPFKREEGDLDSFSQQISYGGGSNQLDSNGWEDQGYSDSFYQQRRGFDLDQPVDNQVFDASTSQDQHNTMMSNSPSTGDFLGSNF